MAGRDAYLAGLNAATAWIAAQTGKWPRTHSGTRAEFARISRDDGRIPSHFPAFLAKGYEMKTFADYGAVYNGERIDAAEALAVATEFVTLIAGLLELG